MEIALHMTGVEDVIDNPRRVGDKVSMNNKRKVEFQVDQCERQCHTNNLVNMWSKEVLMANLCWSMENVTVFAHKEMFNDSSICRYDVCRWGVDTGQGQVYR